jgi:hypothetical protein
MIVNMNLTAEEMKRQSMMHSKFIEFGEDIDKTNFSLAQCSEWEKSGH